MPQLESKENQEIEVRFLEINKNDLVQRLKGIRADDQGEQLLKEVIFYNSDLSWRDQGRFVRVRQWGDRVAMTYKHHQSHEIDGTEEIELSIENFDKAILFLERIGLRLARFQEKRRHTFRFNGAIIDIDTWPRVPTYVEIEGVSEKIVRETAEFLGFDWSKAVFESAGYVIENRYGIPVTKFKYFTFDRFGSRENLF